MPVWRFSKRRYRFIDRRPGLDLITETPGYLHWVAVHKAISSPQSIRLSLVDCINKICFNIY